jgi:hypothetical protein
MVIQRLSFGVNKCWWLFDVKCYHVFLWHHVQNMEYLVVLDNILMLNTNGYDKKTNWDWSLSVQILVNVLIDCTRD